MNDNIAYLSACQGKQSMTWAVALAAKIKMNRSHKRVYIYHCQFCRAWYVGGKKMRMGRT